MNRTATARRSRLAAFALLLATLASGGCADRRAPVVVDNDETGAPSMGGHLEDREAIEAVQAGYVERLRLGLGSPFRLIDFALSDPRLDVAARRRVANTLLELTLTGRLYEIDPGVLQPGSDPATMESLTRATRHLQVIENAIASAEDPRAGELAVRLAYQLARLETEVGPSTLSSAVRVAALLRDRELAIRDAHALVRAADEADVDAIDLVSDWRAERRFWVERPVLQSVGVTVEQAAIDVLSRLAHAVRLAANGGDSQNRGSSSAGADIARLRYLDSIDSSFSMPPRSAIVVSIGAVGATLPDSLPEAALNAWSVFVSDATTEESLAIRAADLSASYPALRGPVGRSILNAAIALRPDAQEEVWFPGMAAPTPQDILRTHGVKVTADEEVPADWTPFVLLSLDGALQDLRLIVPKLNLSGLEIAISSESAVLDALASHSPRTRVIDLPVSTGLGTIAHEIAHDLDWQTARRARSNARTYASESEALRGRPKFRAAVATLTPAAAGPWRPSGAANASPSTRPAEVVARTFDWFVATRLAARGLWNGSLSAGQDEILTGHGSIQPPGSSVAYGAAAVEVMRPLAILPDREVEAFLMQYGPSRGARAVPLLDAYLGRIEGVGKVTPRRSVAEGGLAEFGEIFAARDRMLEEMGRQECVGGPALVSTQVIPAYARLIEQAAAARGRGLALRMAETIAGDLGRAWMSNRLYGPLWPAVEMDASLTEALEEIAAATIPPANPRIAAGSTFDFGIGATACTHSIVGATSGDFPHFTTTR